MAEAIAMPPLGVDHGGGHPRRVAQSRWRRGRGRRNPLYGGKRQGPQRDRDLFRRHPAHPPGRAPTRRYRAGGHPVGLSVAARRGNADCAASNSRTAEPVPMPAEPAPVAKPEPAPTPAPTPLRRADHQPPCSARGLGAWGGMACAYGQRAHGPDRRARHSRGCRPQRPSGPRDSDDPSRRYRASDVAPTAQGRGCAGTCVSPHDCQASGRRLGRASSVERLRDRGRPSQPRRRYG